MLEGVNSEDKEVVTTVKGVIKAVLDGVKVMNEQVPGSPPSGSSELHFRPNSRVNILKTCGIGQFWPVTTSLSSTISAFCI